MPWILGPCLKGLGLYFLLCVATVLTGRGLIHLIRLKIEERTELVFASILGFIFWSLCLGVAGGFRVPVKGLAPWLWGASALVSAIGLCRRWPAFRSSWPALLLCVALPVVLMGHCFLMGITEDADRYAQ